MAGAWGTIYGYYGNQLYEYIGTETSIELISTDMTMGNWTQSNAYDFTLTGTIASSDTIIVASGQTLKLQNGWTNEGTIVNYGTVDTTGTFTNSGTITNTASGTFISENGLTNSGVINNYGTIELKSGSATNSGTVTNYEGSTTTGAVTWTGTSPTTAPSDPVVVTDFATYYWSGTDNEATWTDSANWKYKGLQGTSEVYVSVKDCFDGSGISCNGRYPGCADGDVAVFQGSVTVDV
ncbi:MAG: hypothetical protein IJ727_12810, partial [Treponema sp.]|nr:hypothetical protein [Treponema sp.]